MNDTSTSRVFSRLATSVALALAFVPGPASAQPRPAGVVTSLTGQATVARASTAAPVPLHFKDGVFARDRIETRQDSVVRVLLGGKALVTIREFSVFTVTEDAGRAQVDLQQGRLALGVARSQLRPGESIEIRTPNAVAAVRGSEVVADVSSPGGVPQTTITTLDVSLPVTVAPRANPAAAVTLGINQAVSVLGLVDAATITPIRNLTPVQVQDMARAGRAPRPREQTDKAPEGLVRRVSEDKAKEAAQLSDALAGREQPLPPPVSSTVDAEIASTQATDVRTQNVFTVTDTVLLALDDATRRAILEGAAAEPDANPQFVVADESVQGTAADTVKTYSGTVREVFAPVAVVISGGITQTGQGGALFNLEPGADVTLPGSLFVATSAAITTGGSVLTVGEGASLKAGLGILGALTFTAESQVTTGAELVSLGPGSKTTLPRSLVASLDSTFSTGTLGEAAFVSIGDGAQVFAPTLPFITLSGKVVPSGPSGTSVMSTGPLLSIGANAFVQTQPGIFGLITAGTGRESLPGSGSDITTGAELLTIGPGARVDLHQSLVSLISTTVHSGVLRSEPTPLVRIAGQIDTDVPLPIVLMGGGAVFTTGAALSLESGAVVNATGSFSFPLLGVVAQPFNDGTTEFPTLVTGTDVVSLGPGSRLSLDRPIVAASSATLDAGGSILSLAPTAVLSIPAPLGIALLVFGDSVIGAGGDMVWLQPGASLDLNRPLLAMVRTFFSGAGLLSLGAGAVLTNGDVSIDDLLAFRSSEIHASAGLVRLGMNSRIDMVRPLIDSGTSLVETDHSALWLGAGARLVSSGQAFALFTLDQTALTTGDAFTWLGPGAHVALGRTLLSAFDSALQLGGGLLKVSPGADFVVAGSTDPLAVVVGGTHAIASADGSAMIDLAGSATAVDPESGLTVGTDRPLQHGGAMIGVAAATVTGQKAVRIDTALLEASAPLMVLVGGTNFTTAADAIDLSMRAKVTSLGPVTRLDASTLNVTNGALASLAGGSVLKVTGDFLELRNGSTLNLFNGPILSISDGSLVNVSGALVNFGGTGGNKVNVTNALCPCTVFSGVPVALQNGALASNVSIGPNPIRNPGLGSLNLSSPATAAIVLSGPASRVTIGAQ